MVSKVYYLWGWPARQCTMYQWEIKKTYRISANSCRDNYSFLRLEVRQLFKGDNYSREETIVFLIFVSFYNLNCCRKLFSVTSKFYLKLTCNLTWIFYHCKEYLSVEWYWVHFFNMYLLIYLIPLRFKKNIKQI